MFVCHKSSASQKKKETLAIDRESILPNFFYSQNKDFFQFFAIKLGCFIAKGLLSYVTNTQA
jgi:hypothetical protein